MAQKPKPIFCVTHPRACSTAFERVFMTRDDLACVHEPFGDAFYYGPERMSIRYDEEARKASGFAESTYATIFEQLEKEGSEGKRVFIKDMIYYVLPPNGKPPQIAPSLLEKQAPTNGQANGDVKKNLSYSEQRRHPWPYGTRPEPGNPTVIPRGMLEKFHFTFLIRDPHFSIPSYYRCTIPPLDKLTGWDQFYPSETGYEEVRRVFDYLITAGMIGPSFAGSSRNGEVEAVDGIDRPRSSSDKSDICVVDADDLLDNPEEIIKAYCQAVDLDFSPDMLRWDSDENLNRACAAFEKWKGFHEDAIHSTELRARSHTRTVKSELDFDCEWTQKYGLEGANIIRKAVDENMETYLYLKQHVLKVTSKNHGYGPQNG